MGTDWAETELGDLRDHWGSAYSIHHPEPDVWLAQRRDSCGTLRTDSPDTLRDRIRADYAARPVPRGPTAKRQFLPEG
jgi:hypothetical protein